ncbi:MAG: molybdopterin-dependent oxidoreductase [Microthrixaceae bacterium]
MPTTSSPRARARAVADRVEHRRADAERREVHDARTASLLGMALGIAFAICFATGVWSHLQQHPPGWLTLPIGPVGLYRVTQGLHVITGLIAVPLLLAKLYSVSPQLLQRPAVRGPVHAMERLAILPLVGGSLFLLLTGAGNIARWYPWEFFFTVGHWWAAWLVLGATMIHLAFKVPVVRASLAERAAAHTGEPSAEPGELTRRGLFVAVGAAAALLTIGTAGQTVPALRRLTWFAPRRPDIGPQGFPVNRTAAAAGTTELADDPGFRLDVVGGGGDDVSFTLEDLHAMPQRTEVLPISCVEGWSAEATWTGVSVAEVLRRAGRTVSDVTVRSAQTSGGYRSSELSRTAVDDERCLLALSVNGEVLHPDHGAPLRLIAPNRPGVLQTKWVVRLEAT